MFGNERLELEKEKIMILNIAVCDDKKESIEAISEELYRVANNIGIDIETYLYTDGYRIVELLLNNKEDIHVLFLDIDMPIISGLEIAKILREDGSDIILIFISAHEQYVFESIDYNPFKYIRKSKMKEEIEIALKQAYKRVLADYKKKFIAKTEDGEIRIDNSDIMYFEMELRRIVFVTKDGEKKTIIGRKSIKELNKELDDEDFIQIHSGCIVNAKYIDEYSGHDVTLDNGQQLIVSRSRIKEVKDAVSRYWRKRV